MELVQIDETFEKENETKKTLLDRLAELEKEKNLKDADLSMLKSKLQKTSLEPGRISRQADATQKAVEAMTEQLNGVNRKIAFADAELQKCAAKRESTEKLKLSILEKNEIHRLTIEKREKDVASLLSNLENEKALLHDNITNKMELNLKKKEVDAEYRHTLDALNFLKKDYDNAKRIYKKKRSYADSIRSILPTLGEQLVDEQHNISLYQGDRDDIRRRNEKLKEEIDIALAMFLDQEGIEKSKKEVYIYLYIFTPLSLRLISFYFLADG